MYITIQYDSCKSIWSALFSILIWGFFTAKCWSKLYTIGELLQIVVKIMLDNPVSVIFGTLLCLILQIFHIFLAIRSKFWMFFPNAYVFTFFILNFYWTTAYIDYFFKVYSTSVVTFHFINKGDTKISVLKESFKNTLYALGSISFPGFINALIITARMIADEENNNNTRNRNNTLEYLIF